MRELKEDWLDDFFVIDWETFYSTEYSIRGNCAWSWVRDPRFDPYLPAIKGVDFEFSGRPWEFNWNLVMGKTAIAHNVNFDQPVTERAIELGIIPELNLKGWVDTAEMTSYFQYGRSLADAYKAMYDHEVVKDTRDYMKGRSWDDFVKEGKDIEVIEYAMHDAQYEWDIFKDLYPIFPEFEEKVAALTRLMGKKGLPVDTEMLEESIEKLSKEMWKAKNNLPWFNEIDPDTRKPYVIYSKKALSIECRKRDIPIPASLAQDSPEFDEWVIKYGSQMSFVADMQNYQRMNKHYQSLKTIEQRLTDEGRMQYNLKYYGAEITGRCSGDSGFNVQNMPREAKYGVNIRNIFSAPKGHKLIIADLSQIEARLQWWKAGDEKALEFLKSGMSPYEAHARLTMGWDGGELKKEDPNLYLLAKTRVLQLGYGCGWHKFYETVRSFGELQILEGGYSPQEKRAFLNFIKSYQPKMVKRFDNESKATKSHWINSFIQVRDFREKNPKITKLWNEYGWYYNKTDTGSDYEIDIEDGRTLRFFNVREEKEYRSAKLTKGGRRRGKYYSANLFQNVIQGLARSVFSAHLLSLSEKGYSVILQVHDELVLEVPESEVKQACKDVEEVMSSAPEWCDCPIECEYSVVDCYTK